MSRPTILDHAAQLAEITRCRILRLVDLQELAVSELCAVLQLPQSTVSRHLKVLAEGGWVTARRDGTSNAYRRAEQLEESASQLWRLISEQIADTAESQQDLRRLETVLEKRRSRSREFFSTTAARWDHLRDDLFGRRFDLLSLLGLLDPACRVGDLGCGTGRISEALAPFVDQLIAVDGSAAMLDAARQRLARHDHVKLRQGDLERLPLDDASLDVATLFLTLHHQTEPVKVLGEAQRVLRPNGRLLVVDMQPHSHEEFRVEMGHVWLGFSEAAITRSLSAAGFAAPRYRSLPSDPEAKGPDLFVATARVAKPSTSDNAKASSSKIASSKTTAVSA